MKNTECSIVKPWDKYHTTVIKGIAMLCIMLSHITNAWGVRYFTPLGGIGVAAFLMVSGYGLAKSFEKNGLKDFWKKRIVHSYIPYFIINIIGIGIAEGVTLKRFFASVCLIRPFNAYWWFMQYLFMQYAIFWLVKKLKINDWISFTASAVALFLAFKYKSLWAEQSISFAIGVFLAKKEKINIPKWVIGILGMILGCLALGMKQIPAIRELSTTGNIEYIWNTIQLLNKIGIAVGMIFLSGYAINWKLSKPLEWVGTVSFELYLVHAYTIAIINKAPKYVGGYIIFAISTALFAIVFHYVNKRIEQLLMKKGKR